MIATERALLPIRDDLDGEADYPNHETGRVRDPPARWHRLSDRSKRRAKGEKHPEPLQCPGNEKARRTGLDLIEAAIGPVRTNASKEKGAESQRPQADEDRENDGARIIGSCGDDRDGDGR